MAGTTTRDLLAALDEVFRTLLEVAESLEAGDWDKPTGCPGWTVKDNLSHVVAIESELAGDPLPDVELPAELRHVKNELGRHMERGVHARRGRAPHSVLAELKQVIGRRRAQLNSLTDEALEGEATGPRGSTSSYRRMLRIRVFDIWAHEQDIRRAVGRPGNLDGKAASVSVDTIFFGLTRNLPERVPAPPGTTVTFTISGREPETTTLHYGVEGVSVTTETPRAPSVAIATDMSCFAALGCGREDAPAGGSPQVAVQGDEELGRRVLSALAVTP